MRLDLPVMLIVLTLSAVAQNLLPGMPGSPLKIPFLSGVVVYYALNRPSVMALVASVWAGWLTDSAGGLPSSCTATFLLLLTLVTCWPQQTPQVIPVQGCSCSLLCMTATVSHKHAARARSWTCSRLLKRRYSQRFHGNATPGLLVAMPTARWPWRALRAPQA